MLWARLRNMQLEGVKFRRQQPLGSYIVDFISFDKKLIIESMAVNIMSCRQERMMSRGQCGWMVRVFI